MQTGKLVSTLLLFQFFSLLKVNSQTYHAFPSSIGKGDSTIVAMWTGYFYEGVLGGPPFNNSGVCKVAMIGDTIINSISYSKLYLQSEFIQGLHYYLCDSCDFTFDIKKAQYVLAMREANKAIYMINPNSTIEYKPFDFNLTVGDTLWTDILVCDGISLDVANYNGAYIKALSMDSLLLTDGSYRKKYNMTDGGEWIEGIGTSRFFSTIIIVSEHYLGFGCYTENGKMLLDYTYYLGVWNYTESCVNTVTQISKNNNVPNFKVYPNPCTELLHVELPENNTLRHIKILNLLGETLYSNSINSNEYNINTKFLNIGIYYLEISSNVDNYSTKIMISK